MTQRRLAWAIWAVSVAFALVWVLVDASLESSDSGVGDYLFILGGILLYATVGALITSRQRGNRVGLIFAWVALAAAGSGASGAYARLAVERGLPLAGASTWLANIGVVAIIGPIAFLFLIFPTGSPLSRRWGWLLKVMVAAYAITVVVYAVTPGLMRAGFADIDSRLINPIGLPLAWKGTVEAITTFFGGIVFLGAIASTVSLIQRYRGAATEERQQIRWLGWLGAFTAVYLIVFFVLQATGVLSDEGLVADLGFLGLIALLFVGIPVTCGVAILKHGLWDLDVVVKKTVQYSLLVAGFMIVVGLVVLLAPLMVVGVGSGAGFVPTVVVGVVLAIGFTLVRSRAQRWANRIVYGKRSTPYEILSEFAERVGETYSTEDVLPRMAQLLGEATGARTARVWLRIADEMREEASWPADAPPVPAVSVPGDELPSIGDDEAFEVRHQGELLGALSVAITAADPMNATKAKLARDMAAQAGLVLRNVRLIEDLRESRRRIVAAQDVRAKKLERDIHDGAQQQLVALQVKQRLADSMIDRDPARAHEMLAELQYDTASALDELRDLARGIYPPLLADQGLAAALNAQARRSVVPVDVLPDGIGRYSQEIESAVYFSCLEALQNVAKYAQATGATLTLRSEHGVLAFEVTDDGRGFDPATASRGSGLQGIADRLAALGGRLDVRSAPGSGTTLIGTLPAEGTS
jgi:signal transduction histidine kinase